MNKDKEPGTEISTNENTENTPISTEYERGFSYEVHADMTMCGPDGALTPQGWQKLVVEMIERHLENIGMGERELLERTGASWILLSTHVRPARTVRLGEHLVGRTWNAGVTPPIFRRDLIFYGADGEPAAVGATYSTLFSAADRRVCTDRALIEGLALPAGEKIADAPRRAPRVDNAVTVEERVARPSMTDSMGHVNNTRYGEFVYDALSDDERACMSGVDAFDIWFYAELRAGDRFTVERAVSGRDVIVIGRHADGRASFVARLSGVNKDGK